ncbi:MAG: hypothetical protein RXR01_09910, partial [Thermoproteus sp.]
MPRPKRTGGRAAAGGGQMSREIGGFVVTVERQGRQWRIEVFNGEQAWSKVAANPLGRAALSFLREVGLSRKEIEEYRRRVERLTEPSEKEKQGKRGRGSRPPRRQISAKDAVQQQATEAAPAEQGGEAPSAEHPRAEDAEKKAEEAQASESAVAAGEAAAEGTSAPKEPIAVEAPQKSEKPSAEGDPEPAAPQQEEHSPQKLETAEGSAEKEAGPPPEEPQRGQPAEAEEPPKAAGPFPPEAGGTAEAAKPPIEAAKSGEEALAVADAAEGRPSEPPLLASEGKGICGEENAQVFTARDLAVLVRLINAPRRKIKYEVRIIRPSDCTFIDIIPETSSLTSRDVHKMLRHVGLTPEEIAKYVEWARGLGSKHLPKKEVVAATFRKVVESARGALSGRLDSPYLDLLIPKRDKETVTNCRPAECWKSANAVAVVPSTISEVLGVLDLDSEEAVKAAEEIGFDPKRHMHITSGPAVDAVLTPEGKWRTPDGRVLDDVPRKFHILIYIPEGCRMDLVAPGFELKCRREINIAGRHPSGAEYKFVDGELLEAPLEKVKEFAASLGGDVPGYETPPKCEETRHIDVGKLAAAFQRIYVEAQVAGYSRHDAIYDLATLGRFSCIEKEEIKEVVRKVYGVAGAESQTLPQRLTHVERAYRTSKNGPKLRDPRKIFDVWSDIDEDAAEEIFELLAIRASLFLAEECLTLEGEDPEKSMCKEKIVAELVRDGLLVSFYEVHCTTFENEKTGEEVEVCTPRRKVIYRGPRPKRIHDIARQTWFYEIGGFYGSNLEQVVEKIRQAKSDVTPLIKTTHFDELVTVLKRAAEEKAVALTVGLLPTENGTILVDDHGILDLGPSPEEAVADLDKALRSVLAVYPEANHDPALAAVGYILGLNAAPIWWYHKPNSEVPLPIVHGASGLGKSELMRRVVEPAVVGLEAKSRIASIREKIVDETLHDYLAPDVYKIAVYSTPQQ